MDDWPRIHSAINADRPTRKLPRFNFLRNEELNRLIGVEMCKWIVANSFIKCFNQNLRMPPKRPTRRVLLELSDAMTYAETVHLIAFVYVIGDVLVSVPHSEPPQVVASLLVLNIFVNFYASLVQQMNKRRISRLIQRTIQ
ncbi:MAG: hypothetical protein P8J27_09460 [Mariniblastus sp.]|nr:hypothetical protein [Mariniblastus sp.]